MKRLLRRTSFYPYCAAVLCIFIAIAVATTLRGEPAEPDYLLDIWSTEQGLPNATISGIAQTPDGYLWCGTYDGVVRFDGVRFVRIGPDDSTNQEANRVQCLFVDRRGQLWIGTDGAGLLQYSNGRFTAFAERAGSSMNAIRSIAEDGEGNLWLGTRGGIGRFRNGQTTWFTDSRGITNSSKSVWNLAFDRTGGLWVADWTSLKVFDGSEFLTASLRADVNVPLRAVYCDDNGVMWAGMLGQALRREADGTWAGVDDDGFFTNVEVTTFCKTSAGEFWAGTRRGLCRAGPDGRWSNFAPRGAGAINSDVRVLFEDRERNLWVGTGSAGLVRLKRRIVETYSAERGIAEGPVFGVCEKRDGGLLLALNNGHVVQSAGTDGPFHRLPGVPSDTPIKTLLKTRDGALWIGTFGNGLFRISSFNSAAARSRPVRLRPTVGSPARIDRVTALLEDRAGDVWIGSYYSLYKGGDSNTVVPVSVGGREMRAPAIALLQDRHGAIWVGWEGFGVSRLTGDEAMWLTRREGLPTHFIRAFHEDTSGIIWIGTTAGLCSWREGKLHTITKSHGLIDDSIMQILQDDSDNLWLGSNKGIMRVARKELLAVADGKKNSIEIFACGRGEGMLSEQCSGAFSPAAVKTGAGKLCFPTANGLVVVDPVHLKLTMNPDAPPVYIEEIRADGKTVAQPYVAPGPAFSKSSAAPLVLEAGTRRLEFDFTAPGLTAPERVRFKYRLEGFDSDWTEATTSRSAVYPNITPGRYSFHVLACNADSVWNPVGHAMTFRIAAPFWQTWWFLGIAAFASAGLVGGGVRLVAVRNLRRRLRRLEEAHAIEKERMRIAQDMHDEIGGKLSRISFLSDMARHNVPDNSKAGHQIEEVSEAAREVIRTVDEIVWAVSPRNDTIESVVHYICRHAEEFFELTSVELELDLPRDFPDCRLSAEVRHNLFCAVKESLNNVLKHAAASRVRIAFIISAAAFKIVVTDDGRGFYRGSDGGVADHLTTRHAGEQVAVVTRVGNGLLNMQERLQSVHGTFSIESEAGKGTRVAFELPLT